MYINLYSRGVLINPYKIPLLNTAILITSGFVLTLSHSYIRTEIFRACYRTLIFTICLGLLFISLQAKEYIYSGFSMNDGVYGSIFYMLTGFHGFHVIIGTIFLIVIAFRVRLSHFTHNNHFAFEAAA
jgi:heme/copper-type cytochrome/quinol oxidase subunit 3